MHLRKIPVLCIFFLFISNGIWAQNVNLQQKISISIKELSLKEALDKISREAGVLFSYSNEQINDNQQVSVVVRNMELRAVLDKLFRELDIEYLVVEKQIVLKRKTPTETEKEEKVTRYTISGYLKDSSNNEVLIGATVRISGTNMGAVSNSYGFYSLTLPEGTYTLQYSYIGYQSKSVNIKLNKDIRLSQNLMLDEND